MQQLSQDRLHGRECGQKLSTHHLRPLSQCSNLRQEFEHRGARNTKLYFVSCATRQRHALGIGSAGCSVWNAGDRDWEVASHEKVATTHYSNPAYAASSGQSTLHRTFFP